MVDAPAKKEKKGEVGEEDVCILLQRFSVEQVLSLLRELAQSPDLDWNALVKKTELEINNARECQMLWRHLAYRQPLADEVEEGAQPLDDDSDLEYELEASPPISIEFAMEVANCVKVLSSGSPNESSMPNSLVVEGDLPNVRLSKTSSENPHSASLLHSTNITLPSSVRKQQQSAGPSGEALDANSLADNRSPPRKRRKHWSYQEDLELIAAVKKFGEGNWANIVKGEFKGDRSASQLSQRWAIIRKKQGILKAGGVSSQLSEAQLATRRAIDMALKDNLTGGCGNAGNGAAATSNHVNVNASSGDMPTAGNTVSSQLQTSVKPGPMSMAKPHPPLKKAPTIPNVSDSIQAAAVAAGARIATPSDAATLFKAAQSKNAVRIIGGSSLIKSSATASSPLPPNVHFIRTGLAAPAATSTAAGTAPHHLAGGQQTKGSTVKPTVPAASVSQLLKGGTAPVDQSIAAPSISASEPKQMEENTSSEVKVLVPEVKPVAVQEDNACLSGCLPKAPGMGLDPGKLTVDADYPHCIMSKDKTEGGFKNPVDSEKHSTVQGSCDLSMNMSNVVSPSSVITGGCVEKMVSDEADYSDQKDL